MCFTVKRLQTAPGTVREALGLSVEEFRQILTRLEGWKLVAVKGDKVVASDRRTHMEKDHPVFRPFHILRSLKLMDLFLKEPKVDDLQFSVLLSSNTQVMERFRSRILDALQQLQEEVGENEKSSVFMMGINLARIV